MINPNDDYATRSARLLDAGAVPFINDDGCESWLDANRCYIGTNPHELDDWLQRQSSPQHIQSQPTDNVVPLFPDAAHWQKIADEQMAQYAAKQSLPKLTVDEARKLIDDLDGKESTIENIRDVLNKIAASFFGAMDVADLLERLHQNTGRRLSSLKTEYRAAFGRVRKTNSSDGAPPNSPPIIQRREINITGRDPFDVACEVVEYLAQFKTDFFVSGGTIGCIASTKKSRLLKNGQSAPAGVELKTSDDGENYYEVNQVSFAPYDRIANLLNSEIQRYIQFVETVTKDNEYGEGEETTKALGGVPGSVQAQIRALAVRTHDDERYRFKTLRGIANGIMITSRGTLTTEYGYNARTGIFNSANLGLDRTAVETAMRADLNAARQAFTRLWNLTTGFVFDDGETGGVVAVAALMTAALRASLPLAPAIGISGPDYGAGKSYFADMCALTNSGEIAATIALAKDLTEFDKTLDSALRSKRSVISLDNLTYFPNTPKLAQCITSEIIEVRPMGQNDTTELVDNRALLIMNGNGCLPERDMVRRVLFTSLGVRGEAAEKRKYHTDARTFIQDHRAAVLIDIATISCAYINHVRQSNQRGASLSQFHDWDLMVRQPIMWMGGPDVIANWDESRHKEEDRQIEAQFFSLLYLKFHEDWFFANDALNATLEHDVKGVGVELLNTMKALFHQATARVDYTNPQSIKMALGRLIKKHVGQTRGNLKLVSQQDAHAKVNKYKIETV